MISQFFAQNCVYKTWMGGALLVILLNFATFLTFAVSITEFHSLAKQNFFLQSSVAFTEHAIKKKHS